MTGSVISWVEVGLLIVASIGLLLSRDWRWNLGLLAAQYLAMFLILTQFWPFGLAAVKLVTGWMAAATLGVTRLSLPEESDSADTAWPQGRLFRLFAALIVVVLAFSVAPTLEGMIPGISRIVVLSGMILFGMGLLHLGITSALLRAILGLLTLLAGFEILYSAVETSILLAGLLAVINLGLALIGSYLMNAAQTEEETL